MSLSADIHTIHDAQDLVVRDSPGATHGAGAYNAFAIAGGPVWIRAFLEYNVTLIAGGTTTTVAVGAIGLDTGAQLITGAANTMVVSPLDAAVAKLAVPALAVQMPSLLGYATNVGVVAAPGANITVTFAGVAMAAAEQTCYYVVYRKLSPLSRII